LFVIRKFNIPYSKVGKLIVATSTREIDILNGITQKAKNNGVTDLTFLSAKEAEEMEPSLSCKGALLSPSTGIIDTHQFMLSLVGEIESLGGAIAFCSPFHGAMKKENGFDVRSNDTTLSCMNLINSAGLDAQNVAENIETVASSYIPKRYLAKGSYFTMNHPSPFKHLIYPVPNTASLGIHVTLDLAGQIRFGPDQEWIENIDYEVDITRGKDFYAAIRRYYPSLPDNSLIAAYAGIRPKTQSPTDSATDFCFSGPQQHSVPGLINLFGIESPGLTSSLRIGQHIREILYR